MLDWLSELFDKFANAIMAVLPTSPFTKYLSAWADLPYLGWLNWFVPLKECLTIFAVYLVCIGTYYLYSIILRWLRALK